MNYTSELHTRILIALLKKYGIRKVVASPGATNVCFVGSIQQDPFFTIYSSVDERSAAFIACGMAAEGDEPVAIVCTGSTASRNYIPGLTEAFYRHLPVLAITTTQHLGRVGNLCSQVIDRSVQLKDMVKESFTVDVVHSDEDIWACELGINKVLLALSNNGGGPAHINLVTTYSKDYTVKELPSVKKIDYICSVKNMPSIKAYKRIAILVGVHSRWHEKLLEAVDEFCQKYDAVVLRSHADNYKGNYGVNFSLFNGMAHFSNPLNDADLVIFFGDVPRYKSGMESCHMWRVTSDGKIADPERRLTKLFSMDETDFFEYYNNDSSVDRSDISCSSDGYARQWQKLYKKTISEANDIPFSNVWIAQNTISKIPGNAVLHMAGSNTARAWNYFELPSSVECYSNDGTMGIDGQLSALIGESLAAPDRLHFGVMGDLTVFYDLNSLGNRHIGKNIRLMIVNNGGGGEFKIYSHPAYQFGDGGNPYMAATGHFGNKSRSLLRHYAEDLGYEYLSADDKDSFLKALDRFCVSEITDRSMIFEVFTDTSNESDAIYAMRHLVKSTKGDAMEKTKDIIKNVAGKKVLDTVQKIINK